MARRRGVHSATATSGPPPTTTKSIHLLHSSRPVLDLPLASSKDKRKKRNPSPPRHPLHHSCIPSPLLHTRYAVPLTSPALFRVHSPSSTSFVLGNSASDFRHAYSPPIVTQLSSPANVKKERQGNRRRDIKAKETHSQTHCPAPASRGTGTPGGRR
jgi:hypothetical protein